MKINHILILCLVVIVILAGLTACQASMETKTVTMTGPTTTVTTTTGIPWLDIPTYNQFGENITAGVGEEFAIALFPQPRIGLNWYPTYDDNLLFL